MKIIYIHHGNRNIKDNNPTPQDDMTKIGYKDCKLVSQLLKLAKQKNNIKAIYTSTSLRCQKTANIINKHLNLPIIQDDRLNEYNNTTETWKNAQLRTENCLDDIIKQYTDQDVIICVTSGTNLVAFINKAYNLPATKSTPVIGVPSCSPLIFDFPKSIISKSL